MDDSTSSSLLEQCRQNMPLGWERLNKLYSPLILYWCKNKNVPPSDWSDVCQNTLMAVVQSFHTFSKKEPGYKFRKWLRHIANCCIVQYFQRQAETPQPIPDSQLLDLLLSRQANSAIIPLSISTLEELSQEEENRENEVFGSAFISYIKNMFSKEDMEIFRLTEIMKYSSIQIGKILNLSPAAVRQRKSRILREIRNHFEDLL